MRLEREYYRSEFLGHESMEKHRELEGEHSFYDAVANGDIEYVEENCNSSAFADPEGMGRLSENRLQNMRYHFVVTTAMITRFCAYAGMEQEKAYGMSDFYIRKMDKCSAVEMIVELHNKMCIDFCKQMNQIRRNQVLTKPVVLCLNYIYQHVHSRLTVKELAEYANLSESYLSKIFCREMGIPVSEYILNLKIEKAKNMLQFSDYSIVDISNYLAFSSQSHFIQVFSKKVGNTPYRYRREHFRQDWNLTR